MATYTIVAAGKSPLDPGEINSGGTILVSDGDIFIIDPGADTTTNFVAASGSASFDVQINSTNTNPFNLKFNVDLTPTVTVADNVNASLVNIDAKSTDAINFTAGDNVSFGQYDGSDTGIDTVSIGNGFTTVNAWKTSGGDDVVTFGDTANINNFDTGAGHDSITFGNSATVNDIGTGLGDDIVRFGDDSDSKSIKTGAGTDTIFLGANATSADVDGGADSDTLNTQTTGLPEKNIETTNVVCFVSGTAVETIAGPVAVEDLKVGQLVRTADHGFQELRWIGTNTLCADALRMAPRLRPIRISKDALGPGLPLRDLLVSPQHRILVRSRIASRMFDSAEVFIVAKKLVGLPGVQIDTANGGIAYYHLLFERHEVIFAESAPCESLYLGPQALGTLCPADRDTITALTQHCADSRMADCLARPSPHGGAKLRRFVDRHTMNGRDMIEPRRPADMRTLAG